MTSRRRWAWLVASSLLIVGVTTSVARGTGLMTGESSHPEAPGAAHRAAYLLEHETGRVLFERDARRPWPPASMVKMMTALVAFDAVREGQIALDDPVRVGPNAARTYGSRVYLRPGEVFPLKDLLGALLVASANDASIAVAEAVAGSVEGMLERMNTRARELGMTETVYRTVNGLPAPQGRPGDVSTARDQAILARRVIDVPEILELSSLPAVRFRRANLRNTNHLVGRVTGVDGLKTGYFRVAGFNLAATASRDDMRLVSVVLGCPTLRCRFDAAERLLEWGFAHYSKMSLVRAGEPLSVEVEVTGGNASALRPVAAQSSTWLLRQDELEDLEVRFQVPSVVAAPVAKDQPLGEVIIRDRNGILDVVPAIAPQSVDRITTSRRSSVSN